MAFLSIASIDHDLDLSTPTVIKIFKSLEMKSDLVLRRRKEVLKKITLTALLLLIVTLESFKLKIIKKDLTALI